MMALNNPQIGLPMGPRPDVRQQRQLQILEAAERVISRLGFHRTRMDDIAAELGLSKGALYWYFESKDAIIAAIARRMMDYGRLGVDQLTAEEKSASTRLAAIDRQIMQIAGRFSAVFPFTCEIYSPGVHHPSLRQVIAETLQHCQRRLADLVGEGMASGEFRPANARQTAAQLLAQTMGLLLGELDPASDDWAPDSSGRVDLLLNGLRER